jgi:hypothetical protein
LRIESNTFGGTIQIAGHYIPANPAIGEMIERRHSACEGVWRLERERASHAKAQVFGRARHRRNQQYRVVERNLSRFGKSRIHIAAVDIIDAEYVGDEKRIKLAAFEDFG